MSRPGRPTAELALSGSERETLQRWERHPTSSAALALRARIVLACADGAANTTVAARLGVTSQTVGRWRSRFVSDRLAGLSDVERAGRPRTLTDAQVEQVVTATLEETPPDGTRWSTRSMAVRAGVSQTAVSRIWRAFELRPDRVDPLDDPRPLVGTATDTTSELDKAHDGAERDGSATRRRLVDIAVQCILELGYYRASSNQIARRAGVTWGVIQHHFGSREQLMLAVLRDYAHRLVEHTRGVSITGGSLRERLDAYYDHVAAFYGRPEYLAYVEVSLDLSRDPATSTETGQTLSRLGASLKDIWCRVPGLTPEMSLFVFESVRGLLLCHRLRDDSLTPNVDSRQDFEARVTTLLDLVAHAAEHQGLGSGDAGTLAR